MGGSANEADIRRIVAAFNAGRHGQARQLVETVLVRAKDDPALNHLHASILLVLEDFPTALAAAERSLARLPGNPRARLLAGQAARACGDLEAAIAHFRQLPAGEPAGHGELARTLEMAGRRAEALESWRTVRQMEPRSREAAARLGRLLWESGDANEAVELLESAVDAEAPASAWFDLGLARQDCGDMQGAAEAFAEAFARRPDDAEAAFNLGAVLQQTGRMDAALSAYRAAYRLSEKTLGVIANALTSASSGRLFLDKAALKAFLLG